MPIGTQPPIITRSLATYLDTDPALALAFFTSYTQQRPLQPSAKQRLQLAMLDDRLIIWEYFQRPGHGWSDNPTTLRQWVSPYLDFIAQLPF